MSPIDVTEDELVVAAYFRFAEPTRTVTGAVQTYMAARSRHEHTQRSLERSVQTAALSQSLRTRLPEAMHSKAAAQLERAQASAKEAAERLRAGTENLFEVAGAATDTLLEIIEQMADLEARSHSMIVAELRARVDVSVAELAGE